MLRVSPRVRAAIAALALALVLIGSASCAPAATQVSSYYDAGAANATVTGAQFVQLFLYHFDTDAAARTLTLPSAADIVAAIPSPVAGQVVALGINASGANPVTITGGAGVTVAPSAATVSGNSTLTVFAVLTNVTKGSEAVTIY